jgi:hypothetical protein
MKAHAGSLRLWSIEMGMVAVLAGALAGCGGAIVGDWQMVQAQPSREVFAIDDAQFHRDGSFAATITIEGKTAREVGTYKFSGFKLTLRPHAGGQRNYNAMVKLGKLEVTDSGRKVVLKKGKKPEQAEAESDAEAGNP